MNEEKLTNRFIELSERNIEAFDGLKEAINKINDTNVLHNARTEEIREHVDKLVTSTETMAKLFSRILWVVVIALIVLAGAEKVLRFM